MKADNRALPSGSIWGTQMRITKAFVRQAKSRIQRRVMEILAIDEAGGSEAMRKEYLRLYPNVNPEMLPANCELMRQLINFYIDDQLPDRILD
jgi:hypothetical protein